MNEGCYAESLCERRISGPAVLGLVLMILAVAGAVVLLFFSTWGFPVLLAVLIAVFFLRKYLRVAYEAIFVSGELQIDRIYSEAARKPGIRLEMADVETVEPVSLDQIRLIKGNPDMKVEDYWSHKEDAKVYKAVYRSGGERHCLLFEPSDKMLRLMYRTSHSKVQVPWEILRLNSGER